MLLARRRVDAEHVRAGLDDPRCDDLLEIADRMVAAAGVVPFPDFVAIDADLDRQVVVVLDVEHEAEDRARPRIDVRRDRELDLVVVGSGDPVVRDDRVVRDARHRSPSSRTRGRALRARCLGVLRLHCRHLVDRIAAGVGARARMIGPIGVVARPQPVGTVTRPRPVRLPELSPRQ